MTRISDVAYVKSGDAYIAYQTMGEGPIDLVFVPGFISHLEMQLELPVSRRFFERLASFSRLIRFDKRGTGLSDRHTSIPTLEQRMEDVRAVMDAAGSSRAALFGMSEGGPMSITFAATYPERTTALILFGTYSRNAWAPDYPWGSTHEQFESLMKAREGTWGQGRSIDRFMPSLASNEEIRKFIGRLERASATPGDAAALLRLAYATDVRHVLPTVGVRTLVLHRTNEAINVEHGRYLARHIKDAKFVELPGIDHNPWAGDMEAVLGEVEEFLTGARQEDDTSLDRVLATVLFTDIVGSTQRAVELGDHAWKDLLSQHNVVVRDQLQRYRGREINTSGDGFLAVFDGPARAVRCAQGITQAAKKIGLRIRAGVHTGECHMMGNDVGGIAVHIGARIGALATADEVLVSSTVRDLVAGSGIKFEPRGSHALRGIPGEWQLLAAL
jgi:class 3 adenylate cyclase/pimeloyl-ACP methyl ester carboxylesterase